MATKFEEQLAQIKAELERQDAEFREALQELEARGDVTFAIPPERIREIEEAVERFCRDDRKHAPIFGLRA